MTPEVLQEKFLDWQCQSRIQAFRTQNGRPNSSMAPILLDKKGNELLRIIFNNNVPKNIKDKNNLIKSRTLNNKKICQLLNLKSDKIHEDTIKQISNFEL